jgi:YfiR/HmsC-like
MQIGNFTTNFTTMKSTGRSEGWPDLGRVLLVGLAVALANPAPAQAPTAGEYQLKAAFLFNFAKFVEWPANAFRDTSAPLRICILGQNPFGQELRNITNEKSVNGRKLQVDEIADLPLARTCHIVFIASSEKAQLKRTFECLQGTSALTVGDTKDFAEQGGMINFVLEHDRMQFEVNHKAADEAGLKISSKLLSVAKLVIE